MIFSTVNRAHIVYRALFSQKSSAAHAVLVDTALVPISRDHPLCTRLPRALHQSPTQQTFRRFGHGIVAHALLLSDQP